MSAPRGKNLTVNGKLYKLYPGVNLSGVNFSGVNINVLGGNNRVNLSGANLSGANLSGANLSRVNFREANLSGANLSGANLHDVILNEANLENAIMNNAIITRAELFSAILNGANLNRANFEFSKLPGAFLNGADLREANLNDIRGDGIHLIGANLTDVGLTRANLADAELMNANLSGANLTGAYLHDANLTNANLTGTDLTNANLIGANLTGTNLNDANTTGAVFEYEDNGDEYDYDTDYGNEYDDYDDYNPGRENQPVGQAFEIHNAFKKLDLNKFMEIINAHLTNSTNLNTGEILQPLINYQTNKTKSGRKKRTDEPIISDLEKIQNKITAAVNSNNEYKIKLSKVIKYVLEQPKEVIDLYINNFVVDCLHAYESGGESCVKGMIERIIMSLRDVLNTFCLEPGNPLCKPEYNELLETFHTEVNINKLLQDWYMANSDNSKVKKMSKIKRIEHFKNYVKAQLEPKDYDLIKLKIDPYIEENMSIFETLQLGGKKTRRKHNKKRKQTRRKYNKY